MSKMGKEIITALTEFRDAAAVASLDELLKDPKWGARSYVPNESLCPVPCSHAKVPFVKSHYSDERVQRGRCPDCNVILLELD